MSLASFFKNLFKKKDQGPKEEELKLLDENGKVIKNDYKEDEDMED